MLDLIASLLSLFTLPVALICVIDDWFFGVSAVSKRPPAHVQELVESIRVPRGAGGAVAH